MNTNQADKNLLGSGQILPDEADDEAAITDSKGPCASPKPAAVLLETDGWFPPSRPRRGCEDC